jgi:hexosaminidase
LQVGSSSLALDLKTNESYTLTVSSSSCAIDAPTVYGAMHGMETFVQLVTRADRSVPAVSIADTPRFAFRAAMIDTSRHFCKFTSNPNIPIVGP